MRATARNYVTEERPTPPERVVHTRGGGVRSLAGATSITAPLEPNAAALKGECAGASNERATHPSVHAASRESASPAQMDAP